MSIKVSKKSISIGSDKSKKELIKELFKSSPKQELKAKNSKEKE